MRKTVRQQKIDDIREAVEELEVATRFIPTDVKDKEKTDFYVKGINAYLEHISELTSQLTKRGRT